MVSPILFKTLTHDDFRVSKLPFDSFPQQFVEVLWKPKQFRSQRFQLLLIDPDFMSFVSFRNDLSVLGRLFCFKRLPISEIEPWNVLSSFHFSLKLLLGQCKVMTWFDLFLFLLFQTLNVKTIGLRRSWRWPRSAARCDNVWRRSALSKRALRSIDLCLE